jgi:DNA-binding CsgD family transcriptional regulator
VGVSDLAGFFAVASATQRAGRVVGHRRRGCGLLGIVFSDIAALVHLSEGTVRNYLSEAINKLGAMNRVDAARLARDKGWL